MFESKYAACQIIGQKSLKDNSYALNEINNVRANLKQMHLANDAEPIFSFAKDRERKISVPAKRSAVQSRYLFAELPIQ
jgi:hypothetical protein